MAFYGLVRHIYTSRYLGYLMLNKLKNVQSCYPFVTRKMGESGRKNAAQTSSAYDLLTDTYSCFRHFCYPIAQLRNISYICSRYLITVNVNG